MIGEGGLVGAPAKEQGRLDGEAAGTVLVGGNPIIIAAFLDASRQARCTDLVVLVRSPKDEGYPVLGAENAIGKCQSLRLAGAVASCVAGEVRDVGSVELQAARSKQARAEDRTCPF